MIVANSRKKVYLHVSLWQTYSLAKVKPSQAKPIWKVRKITFGKKLIEKKHENHNVYIL